MRKAFLELMTIVLIIIIIHTTRILRTGFINGKLYPANQAESILAINGSDSVRAFSKNGYFGMKLRPGVWKVVVSMKTQANSVVRENLEVNEGQNINLGEIKLSD
ncbi:MAG TPA: hypothetical protein VMI12_11570 [Puia sp.]|nr:hypothetical protein [Puia sp.]